jgi:hypothetical protein
MSDILSSGTGLPIMDCALRIAHHGRARLRRAVTRLRIVDCGSRIAHHGRATLLRSLPSSRRLDGASPCPESSPGRRTSKSGERTRPRVPQSAPSPTASSSHPRLLPNHSGAEEALREDLRSAGVPPAVPQTSKSAVPQVSKPAGGSATEPAWKPATPQVWKPAARNRGSFALNKHLSSESRHVR